MKNSFLTLQWLNGTQDNISFKCFVLFPNYLTIRHPYQANMKILKWDYTTSHTIWFPDLSLEGGYMKQQPRVHMASLYQDPCEQKQTTIYLGIFDGVQVRSRVVNCIDLLWFLPAWWFYNPLHLVIHPNKASLSDPMVSSQLKESSTDMVQVRIVDG